MPAKRKRSDTRRLPERTAKGDFTSSLLARLARAFLRSDVPYLLTGADAVSYYGAPRRSDDKDLVVMTDSPEELRRLIRELHREGFAINALEVGHNTTFDSGFRIDIKVKPEVEESRKIKLDRHLWINLTTAEYLILTKLDFWDGTSLESNDAQDIMKVLSRQGKRLDLEYLRAEALKGRSYPKLAKIEQHLRA